MNPLNDQIVAFLKAAIDSIENGESPTFNLNLAFSKLRDSDYIDVEPIIYQRIINA